MIRDGGLNVENNQIDIRVATIGVVVDDLERYWVWENRHATIGYFVGDTYEFHVENRYVKLPSDFHGLSMYLRKNIIYIISKSSIDVLAFDIEEKTFQMYRSDICMQSSQYYSFRKSDNKIMFVPVEMKAPYIEFDIDKKVFREKCVIEKSTYAKQTIGRLEECGNYILIPVLGTGEILILNKENCSYRTFILPYSRNIQCICVGKNQDLWASTYNRTDLIRYFNGNEERIQLDENENIDEPFSKLMYYKDKMIALPRHAQKIYIYDTLEKHIQKINLFEKMDIPPDTTSLIWEGYIKENKLICLPWKCPVVCEVDLNTYHCQDIKIQMDAEDYFKQMCGGLCEENRTISLKNFIQFLGYT